MTSQESDMDLVANQLLAERDAARIEADRLRGTLTFLANREVEHDCGCYEFARNALQRSPEPPAVTLWDNYLRAVEDARAQYRADRDEIIRYMRRAEAAEAKADRLARAIADHRDHPFPNGDYSVGDRAVQMRQVNERLWSALDEEGDDGQSESR